MSVGIGFAEVGRVMEERRKGRRTLMVRWRGAIVVGVFLLKDLYRNCIGRRW